MAKAKVLSKRQYEALLGGLGRILEEGRREAQAAVARQLVQTYWLVGQAIEAARLTHEAGYHDSILSDLAADLELEIRTLQRTVLFYRTYPQGAPEDSLNWTHYRKLLVLGDPAERAYYQQLAVKETMTSTALEQAVREQLYERDQAAAARGVAVLRRIIKRPAHVFYVFKAKIERVVDGDTVIALLDMGFQTHSRQRIRFAKVDAPPLREALGRKAKRFVQQQLVAVDFVVIQTTHRDVHGRYIGHVFYLPDEPKWQLVFEQGRHLNAELVKRGLAV